MIKLRNNEEFKRDHDARCKKLRESGYFRRYYQRPEVKAKKYHKRRQDKKHVITKQEWADCKNYFNNSCAYCGLHINQHYGKYLENIVLHDLHKEHVIDCGKNNLKNCVPSCRSCNSSKNVKTLNEWYNKNNPKYSYERYYKIYMWLRYDYKKFIKPNIIKNRR